MSEALKTILIVDDNHDAADTLAVSIRDYGHKVLVAYDTASGLALAHQWVPDVILHDIGLPIISGYEAARQLRSDAKFAKTVLVALTGYDSRPDREHSKKAGFDFHLDKPIDLGALTIALGQSRPN